MLDQPSGARRKSIGRARNPESHAAILAAAQEILCEGGATAASIEAIARRSSSGKPTIYRWWHGRVELMREVYLDIADRHPWPRPGADRAHLVDLMASVVTLWAQTAAGPALCAMLIDSHDDAQARALVSGGVIVPLKGRFWAIIERAGDAGMINPSAPVDAALDVMVDSLLHALLSHHLPETPERIERLADVFWRLLVAES